MKSRYRGQVKTKTSSKIGLKHGFRSGLEDANAELLLKAGQPVNYEKRTLTYVQPETYRKYTPDFILENGIVIETKGEFKTADRQKHKMIAQCHPFLDLRFVFSNSKQTISKRSTTTYAMWCDRHGFKWADKLIPQEWIAEPVNNARTAAVRKALKWKTSLSK